MQGFDTKPGAKLQHLATPPVGRKTTTSTVLEATEEVAATNVDGSQ